MRKNKGLMISVTMLSALVTACTDGGLPVTQPNEQYSNLTEGPVALAAQLNTSGATMSFTSAAQSVASGVCSAPVIVALTKSSGAPDTFKGSVGVPLSASMNIIGFYADSDCLNEITMFTLNGKTAMGKFYFKGSSAGSPVITADLLNLLTASQTEAITSSSATPTPIPTPASTPSPSSAWSNLAFASQASTFTAIFDAVPLATGANEDSVIGLSATAAAAYTDLAAIIRFSSYSSGSIDVRNDGSYSYDVAVPYVAGLSYHFRVVVNVPAHVYSVYVTPPGQPEILLANNYSFRTEQAAVARLSDFANYSDLGGVNVMNFNIVSSTPTTTPTPTPTPNPSPSPISSSCPANDGSAGAPTGAAQRPNLVSGYATTIHGIGCKIAGVDYAVGVPSTAALVDWQTLSGPGITVNTTAAAPYVRIDNRAGIVISNVDFSLHGGAQLLLVGSPNATVTKCKFGGTNLTKILAGVILAQPDSPGLTVTYTTIDGAGAGSGSTLIAAYGVGTTTLLYNWLKNYPQHVLEQGGVRGQTYAIVYKYNLIEQGAMEPLAHLNYLQTYNLALGTFIDVQFNTTYQTPQASGGEGFQFEETFTGPGPDGKITAVTFAYNTMIATGGTSSVMAMSYLVHAGNGNGVGHDNYMDVTSAYGPWYFGSFTGWSLSSNWNMVTGTALSTNP